MNDGKSYILACKTFIHRFDSDRRLNRINNLRVANRLPLVVWSASGLPMLTLTLNIE